MVQTGVYRGYPTLPTRYFYIYRNIYNPNYPGYTLFKNDKGWYPPDASLEYISILSKISWCSVGGFYDWGSYYFWDGYRNWHYFFYGGILEVNYNNISEQDIWISGRPHSLKQGVVIYALILYVYETDNIISIVGGPDHKFNPTNISSLLQQGINHILWFVYSGPQWDANGFTPFYEDNPFHYAAISGIYIVQVPK